METRVRAFLTAVILVSASLPATGLIMTDQGPEPILVQIKEALRTSLDFDAQLD